MFPTKLVCLVAFVVASSHCYKIITAPIHAIEKTISGSLGLANSSVNLGTSIGSQGLQAATDIGKQTLDAKQAIDNSAIKGAADLGHQALDIPRNITDKLPLSGVIVDGLATMGDKAIDGASDIAQMGISSVTGFADSILDKTNKAGQGVLSTVGKTSSAVIGKGISMSNNFFDKVAGLFSKEEQEVPEPKPEEPAPSA